MSAEVETMVYFNKDLDGTRYTPWHGLGEEVDHALTSEEALKLSGLDWKVNQNDVVVNGNVLPDYRANVRSSDGAVLGLVKNRYKVVQNDEAFAFTDTLTNFQGKYVTAGSLFGGKKVWMLMQLPEKFILNDKVDNYICFTNTHDCSGAIKAFVTPTRVCCNNTLNLALRTATRSWSTKHIGNINSKLKEAKETLKMTTQYLDELDKEANKLAAIKVSDTDKNRIINDLFKTSPEYTDKKNAHIEEQRDRFTITLLAPDLANFNGTGWQIVNAMADFTSHMKPDRNSATFKETAWDTVMAGHPLLDRCYNMVSELV